MLERILAFIEKELKQGRQAYIICPLIEESDKLDVQNAIDVYNMLSDVYRGKWNVGLMHGKLHSDEKDQVMREFSANQCQVLVSTTVVEVGVNVPNATIMVIYDADRFGLSQLHQLRGRVGRGDHQSFCILMADPKSETGKERMRIMSETNDGFELSERTLNCAAPVISSEKNRAVCPSSRWRIWFMTTELWKRPARMRPIWCLQRLFGKMTNTASLRGQLLSSGVLEGEKLS